MMTVHVESNSITV